MKVSYTPISSPVTRPLQNPEPLPFPFRICRDFIKSHFIKGTRIWTDGSVPGGAYETLRKDEEASDFITKYALLNIETGYDYIDILDQDHNFYYRVEEDPEKTNIMIASKTVATNPTQHDYTITGVIHEIDTVLNKALETR